VFVLGIAASVPVLFLCTQDAVFLASWDMHALPCKHVSTRFIAPRLLAFFTVVTFALHVHVVAGPAPDAVLANVAHGGSSSVQCGFCGGIEK